MATLNGIFLPYELMVNIIINVEERDDFLALARTSRAIYSITMVLLYRTIIILSHPGYDLVHRTLVQDELQPTTLPRPAEGSWAAAIRYLDLRTWYGPLIYYYGDQPRIAQMAVDMIKRCGPMLKFLFCPTVTIERHWFQEIQLCKSLRYLSLADVFSVGETSAADVFSTIAKLENLQILILPKEGDFPTEDQSKIVVEWPRHLHHITYNCTACPALATWKNWPPRLTTLNIELPASCIEPHGSTPDDLSQYEASPTLRRLRYRPCVEDGGYVFRIIRSLFPSLETLIVPLEALNYNFWAEFAVMDSPSPIKSIVCETRCDLASQCDMSMIFAALRNGLGNLRRIYLRDSHDPLNDMFILSMHNALKNRTYERVRRGEIDGPSEHDDNTRGVYFFEAQRCVRSLKRRYGISGWKFDGLDFQWTDDIGEILDWTFEEGDLGPLKLI